ncbi:hypothetical protein KEM54_001248 [Ascosphaera aggregata]|nr:hypothetical protein KEM54_001248 [Ascosphaera aggregata]
MSTAVAPLSAAPMASMTTPSTSSKSNGTLTPTPSSSRDRTDRETPRRLENLSPREGYAPPATTSANGISRFSAVSPQRRSPDGTGAGGISANTSSERETIEYRNSNINGKRRSPLVRELHLKEPNAARDSRQKVPEERLPSSSGDKIAVKREPSASPNLNSKTKAPPVVKTTPSSSSNPQVSSPQVSNGSAAKERAAAMRHRPRKLDVSLANTVIPPRGAMTAREGPTAANNMHDIGIACLSPGFQPQDAAMEEKVQRSAAVREQQRFLIEQRLQKGACGGSNLAMSREAPPAIATNPANSEEASREGSTNATNGHATAINLFAPSKTAGTANAPGGSGRRRGLPALSINPAAANQHSHERVIQSAPLNRSFPGRLAEVSVNAPGPTEPDNAFGKCNLRSQPQLSGQSLKPVQGSPGRSHFQQVVHGPAAPTNNRLPSFTDVVSGLTAADGVRHDSSNDPSMNKAAASDSSPEIRRTREYRSAEEAVHELTGGRGELLPRIVHYPGGSAQDREARPIHAHRRNISVGNPQDVRISPHSAAAARYMPTLRRRTRAEYENDNGSPPLGNGPEPRHNNPHHSRLNPTGPNAGMQRPSLPSLSTPAATGPHQHHYHQMFVMM